MFKQQKSKYQQKILDKLATDKYIILSWTNHFTHNFCELLS